MPVRLSQLSLQTHQEREALYAAVADALAARSGGPLFVDLSDISFLPAASVLALVNVARLWHRLKGEPTLIQKVQQPVHQYLERVDVVNTCSEWMHFDRNLPKEECWDRSSASRTLFELLAIPADESQNASAVAKATASGKRILDTWLDCDEIASYRLSVMLAELASNVVHSDDLGFAIMQRYRLGSSARSGSRITLAIADLGIGIERSLRRRTSAVRGVRLTSGSEYILHALKPGVTSRDQVAGIGLSQIRDWVRAWSGKLTIRSEGSCIILEDGEIQSQDNAVVMPGTYVSLSIRHHAGSLRS